MQKSCPSKVSATKSLLGQDCCAISCETLCCEEWLLMTLFKGKGTKNEPFSSKVRDVLSVLIRRPRAKVGDIIRELKGSTPGITELRVSHLEQGEFAEAVKFRLALSQGHDGSNAATCMVEVKLRSNDEAMQTDFQSEIASISGVLEWDLISGGTDYFVRIAAGHGDQRAFRIVENICKLASVRTANTSASFTIWKSGIVDNFSPDDFLEIEGRKEKSGA